MSALKILGNTSSPTRPPRPPRVPHVSSAARADAAAKADLRRLVLSPAMTPARALALGFMLADCADLAERARPRGRHGATARELTRDAVMALAQLTTTEQLDDWLARLSRTSAEIVTGLLPDG